MNVLAHLHLATLSNSSLFGNVIADFVKGDPYTQYDDIVADGIMLHRRVDKITDNLSLVKEAKKLFILPHQRVAPITLDIIWDHFLSKNWDSFHSQKLPDFIKTAKSSIDFYHSSYSATFAEFIGALWRNNWLIQYANPDYIQQTLNGMANRRPKLDILRHTYADFIDNYLELEHIFNQFYPTLIKLAKSKQL